MESPASESQDSASGFGKPGLYGRTRWALNPCLRAKSRQCIYASENDVQELCKENMRRSKLQGYMVSESHSDKHICTVLTFAGRRG